MSNIFDLEDAKTPAAEWDRNADKRALDDLFWTARQYRNSKEYYQLLDFIAHFHFCAPFNAMLVHTQMPGATFVATAHQWRMKYKREIKTEAHPRIILRTMGPVDFVFDVSETEPLKDAPELPLLVTDPFTVRKGCVGDEYNMTIENAMRDGVEVHKPDKGSLSAGEISNCKNGRSYFLLLKQRPRAEYVEVPIRYQLIMNKNLSPETLYATLVHELAHLYCGHLGTPDEVWWPDRKGVPEEIREFEAESVCYLICTRLGIDNPSDQYLALFIEKYQETPPISLDCVLKATGLIERMGKSRLKPRKAGVHE